MKRIRERFIREMGYEKPQTSANNARDCELFCVDIRLGIWDDEVLWCFSRH